MPRTLLIHINEYSSASDLDATGKNLVAEAQQALEASYSPYSKFKVGAAVLLENGKVVKGCNQENAAYPSGLCAERVALFAAGAMYPGVAVKAIAITVKSEKGEAKASAPCGGCRQVMGEFEAVSGKAIRVIMAGEAGGVLEVESVEALLPLMFKPENLK